MSNALIKKVKKSLTYTLALQLFEIHLIINILLIQLATPWETNCNDDNFYSHKPRFILLVEDYLCAAAFESAMRMERIYSLHMAVL